MGERDASAISQIGADCIAGHLLPVDDAVFAVREDLHADRLRFGRTRGSDAEQHEYKAVPRSSKTHPISFIGHHAIIPRQRGLAVWVLCSMGAALQWLP